jgi:peptidyl-prolyl cis-trans isomerase D
MAIIQKIQKQTGCLLLVIGVAMIAFVLTDLISTRTSIFGGNENVVAEISGEKIDYNDLNGRYETMVNNLKINNPDMEVNEEMREAYREQAWNELIQEKIIKKEHNKIGLVVSGAEMVDITVGDNTHPRVKQAFADQNSQVFDKNRFIKFIQEDIEADEELKYKWLTFFETPIKDEIVGQKYATLLKSAVFINKLDAEVNFVENNHAISAQMVSIPFSTISDSAVVYDDSDLKSYLNKNKDKYKQEASADLDFVLFNVTPSAKDSQEVKNWAMTNMEKFKIVKNDSTYVDISGSETFFDNTYKNRGSFPAEVENFLFSVDSGTVVGPYYNNGKWTVYKLSGISYDTVNSMSASHILIMIEAGDSNAALAKARATMAEIKAGTKDFATEAANNFDGSGTNGGSVGWIKEGNYNLGEKFTKEIFRHNLGDMYVMLDERGVHIVKITGGKSRKTIKVAELTRTIEAGTETDKEAYQKAGEFASAAANNKDFDKLITDKGYIKRVADKIQEKDKTIPGLSSASSVIRWVYNPETEKDAISEVMEVDGKYLVAKLKLKRKEGTATIEDVKDQLVVEVVKEKKAEKITANFEKAMTSAKSMDALAKALNTNVQDIPNQSFGGGYVPFAGNDLKLLGTMFGLKEKKMSPIVTGDQGIYVVEVTGKVQSPELPNVKETQRAMLDEVKTRAEGQILEALKSGANIKDFRYKYF